MFKDKELRKALEIRWFQKKKKSLGYLQIPSNCPLEDLIRFLDEKIEKRNERMNRIHKMVLHNQKVLKLLLNHFNLEPVVLIEQTNTTKVERKLRKKVEQKKSKKNN